VAKGGKGLHRKENNLKKPLYSFPNKNFFSPGGTSWRQSQVRGGEGETDCPDEKKGEEKSSGPLQEMSISGIDVEDKREHRKRGRKENEDERTRNFFHWRRLPFSKEDVLEEKRIGHGYERKRKEA